METIGERLRRKREELGLTIEAAAEATKFRPELIRDVEEGRAGLFGARVYQEGFVRTYARFLGLDGDALIRDQKSEEERAQEALKGLKPSPVARPRLRRIAVGIIVVAAIAVAVFLFLDRVSERTGRERNAAGAGAADSAARVQAGARKMRRVASPVVEPAPADSGAAAEPRRVGLPGGEDLVGTPGVSGGGRLFPRPIPLTEAGPAAGGGQPESLAQSAMGTAGERLVGNVPGVPLARTELSVEPGKNARPEPGTQAGQGAQIEPGAQPEPAPQGGQGAPPEPGAQQSGPGKHTLEILARRSVNLTVRSGERVVLDNYWMKRGERVVYTGGGPFVLVSLSDRQGVSVSLDGAAVSLPASEEHGLFNWTVPSGR